MATITYSRDFASPTWSPCSRFIAIFKKKEILLLDAVTFKQLKSYTLSSGLPSISSSHPLLAFSPNSQLLTWSHSASGEHVSWDLQTGVPVSRIPIGWGDGTAYDCSMTYSVCGTMFGVLFRDDNTTTIGTYNILSSACIHHRLIEGQVANPIWTHGECIQFATFVPESITLWEVRFTSTDPAKEIRCLPTPSNFDSSKIIYTLFLPTRSWLAFILEGTIVVWDAHHSKILLKSMDVEDPISMDFSLDGCFFTCGTTSRREIYLWKESPAGYTLYQKFTSNGVNVSRPIISPNGQSIIGFGSYSLQLWHTTGLTISPSSVSSQTPQHTKNFILRFSPDRSLAAATRNADSVATVIDLKSGVTRLVINTGMKIYGLGVTGSTIIVIGHRKVITWSLPAGDHTLNAMVNIDDGVQTAIFNYSPPLLKVLPWSASVSPDFTHIATGTYVEQEAGGLNIYNISTGKLTHTLSQKGGSVPWFTPDGHEIWFCSFAVEGWTIIRDSESNIAKLEYLGPDRGPSGGFPWESSYGHQISNGWILNSSGKQLLWLPHHWRPTSTTKIWDGQFLAILHGELPEVIILELLKE